jgi:SAM-dependent methyltransferase
MHKKEQLENKQVLMLMTDLRTIWDHDYRARGPLWGGSPSPMPEIPGGSRVLEIGCGSGKTAAALADRSLNITAIDFSQKAVEMTRRILNRHHAGDTAVADACQLPFANNVFGCVVAHHVIGHLLQPDRITIACEAARVLQPGGRLLVQEFSVDDMRNGTGKEVEDATFLRGTGIITHYFTEHEIGGLFLALARESVITRHWTIRVKGRNLRRAGIFAVFRK